MYNLVVHLDAERTGEPFVALESGNTAVVADKLFGNLIQTLGSNAWLDPLGDFAKRTSNQLVSLAEKRNFLVCLEKYHLLLLSD